MVLSPLAANEESVGHSLFLKNFSHNHISVHEVHNIPQSLQNFMWLQIMLINHKLRIILSTDIPIADFHAEEQVKSFRMSQLPLAAEVSILLSALNKFVL